MVRFLSKIEKGEKEERKGRERERGREKGIEKMQCNFINLVKIPNCLFAMVFG